jgi:hypothetical protein
MYTMTITSEQHLLLLDLLECAVSELYGEIVRTENLCLKEALKDRKQLLQEMLEEMQSLQPNIAS